MLQAPTGRPSGTSKPGTTQGGPGRAPPARPRSVPGPTTGCVAVGLRPPGALPTPRGFLPLLASPRAGPRSVRTHGAAR